MLLLGLSKPLHRNLRSDFLRELVNGFLWQPGPPEIGVTIGPGATVFTRMRRSASSAAAVRAKERSAAFVRLRTGPRSIFAVCHAGIQDDRRALIQQRQCFLNREIRSLDVNSNCSSYELSDVSASGANFTTPAFTNNTSMLPSFCETFPHTNLSKSTACQYIPLAPPLRHSRSFNRLHLRFFVHPHPTLTVSPAVILIGFGYSTLYQAEE